MSFFKLLNVSLVLVKKKEDIGTMYWLKLCALCDLLEILCALGPESSGSSVDQQAKQWTLTDTPHAVHVTC